MRAAQQGRKGIEAILNRISIQIPAFYCATVRIASDGSIAIFLKPP
jgi:hypothetical protein